MNITFMQDRYFIEGLQVLNLQRQKYCIFDLEGTGIFPETESITQFGALHLELGLTEQAAFSSLVRATRPIPDAVARLTGISNEDMCGAPGYKDVFSSFLRFVGDRVLVTQAGYEYDVPMLRRHCAMNGLPMMKNKVLDTKALFTYIHPEIDAVVSTDYLVSYYGIDTAGLQRHEALADCRLIARIFEQVMTEYEQMEKTHFIADPNVSMRRFVIPAMYQAEGKEGVNLE